MSERRDYLKALTGLNREESFGRKRRPYKESLDKRFARARTKYDLRTLGVGDMGEVYISEEERGANFHILGAPGEGKSKFIEYMIRKDIDAGNGLCLIDPSDGGDTVNNVLAYCEKVGFKKIILIDPTKQKFAKIAALNPKSVKRSVDGVMEALSILFDAKSTSTPRIKRYLSALLRVLARQNLTLKDARYFSNYTLDQDIRKKILGWDRDSETIKEVVSNAYDYKTFFSSSVNRLDALWQEPLASILSNKEGVNFIEAVSDGWVVLVNVSAYKFTEEEAQLLGIMVISQIIQATDVLFNNHWKGVYYLYFDEAGRYATPQIDTLLSYKRKSGLRLTIAHHFNEQFDNRKVFNSIVNNARIKMMFNTPEPDNRQFAMKALGYGGDISPRDAAFANQDLPLRYAIIKKNKEKPKRIRTLDVNPLPPVSKEFLNEIFNQPFYGDISTTSAHIESFERREAHDSAPVEPAVVPRRRTSSIRKINKAVKLPPKKPIIKI